MITKNTTWVKTSRASENLSSEIKSVLILSVLLNNLGKSQENNKFLKKKKKLVVLHRPQKIMIVITS